MKLYALHTIQRAKEPGVRETKTTDGKRPVMETIKPGTVIDHLTDQDEIDDLTKRGALRPATKDEIKMAGPDEVIGTVRAVVPPESSSMKNAAEGKPAGTETPTKSKREVSKTKGKAPAANTSSPDGTKPEQQRAEGEQGSDPAAEGGEAPERDAADLV